MNIDELIGRFDFFCRDTATGVPKGTCRVSIKNIIWQAPTKNIKETSKLILSILNKGNDPLKAENYFSTLG
jgi:hypothetical protein